MKSNKKGEQKETKSDIMAENKEMRNEDNLQNPKQRGHITRKCNMQFLATHRGQNKRLSPTRNK